jgi:hypothetical protein
MSERSPAVRGYRPSLTPDASAATMVEMRVQLIVTGLLLT